MKKNTNVIFHISNWCSHGVVISIPAHLVRVGYTFKGWSPSVTTKMVKGAPFKEQWELNKYTASFNTDGGNIIPNQTINHMGKVVAPPNPTKVEFIFNGWTPSIITTAEKY